MEEKIFFFIIKKDGVKLLFFNFRFWQYDDKFQLSHNT